MSRLSRISIFVVTILLTMVVAPMLHAAAPLSGSVYFGVSAVEVDGEQWAEVRVGALASKGNPTNDYGADVIFDEHNYVRVSPAEAELLADGLDAWYNQPHSDLVFNKNSPDNLVGLGFTGTNWNRNLAHIVLARISFWLGPGRSGGVFVALPRTEVRTLSDTMRTWSENPKPTGWLYLYQPVQ